MPQFKMGVVMRVVVEHISEITFSAATLERAKANAVKAIGEGLFPVKLDDSEIVCCKATVGTWDANGEWIELVEVEAPHP